MIQCSVLVAQRLQGAATGGIGDSFVLLLPRILWCGCGVPFARTFPPRKAKKFPSSFGYLASRGGKARAKDTPHPAFPRSRSPHPVAPRFSHGFYFCARPPRSSSSRSSSSGGLVIERLTWRKRKMKNNEQRTTGRARAFRAAFRALSLFVYFPHDFPPARYHQTSRPIFMDTPVWAA